MNLKRQVLTDFECADGISIWTNADKDATNSLELRNEKNEPTGYSGSYFIKVDLRFPEGKQRLKLLFTYPSESEDWEIEILTKAHQEIFLKRIELEYEKIKDNNEPTIN